MNLSRRVFLGSSLTAFGLACATPFIQPRKRQRFKGGIVGGNSRLGHALRDGQLPAPTATAQIKLVIVGGGIAGLAAARRSRRSGFEDFLLLELEDRPGGNAISGANEVSAYPWAAHYVPISGSDSLEVTQLFEELGVIVGRDTAGLPIYKEEYLCADPMERLFIQGRWQEGFVPQLGISQGDQAVIDNFLTEMHRLKQARGRDGHRAFTIPVNRSSRDESFTQLDSITMEQYLREKGWLDSAPLRWYVDYCCRDDYGAGIDKVSAWAGVHYFASRDGLAANAASYSVVTWPEGNGWFVHRIQASLADHIRSSCAVWNVERDEGKWRVDFFDARTGKSTRLIADAVLWAAPQFVARRAIAQLRNEDPHPSLPVYSPWMVANVTLDQVPGGRGMDLAWDNVNYTGKSLGYVVATHQTPERVPRQTVLTFYQPLDADEPAAARQKALARSYEEWCDSILDELRPMHPDLPEHIRQLDVWVWGHAMVRPVPGFIWGAERSQLAAGRDKLVFAHSDLSGLALFEEAYTRGVQAADMLLEQLGHASTKT
jgi:protoporphyrinogen oxidase